MSDQENIERRGSRMPSLGAANAVTTATNWAYGFVTGAGRLPSREDNVESLQFGYSAKSRSRDRKDIAEIRRDSQRDFLAFCAVRATIPKSDALNPTQAEDYLFAKMHFLERGPKIIVDIWKSPANLQLEAAKIDFDELRAGHSEGQLDRVVLGEPDNILSEAASTRVMFIISGIVQAAAIQVSSEKTVPNLI